MMPGEMQAQLDRHEVRIKRLEMLRETDRRAMDEIRDHTGEIVTLLRDARGAWRVLELVGKTARPLLWLGGLITMAGVLWAQLTGKRL